MTSGISVRGFALLASLALGMGGAVEARADSIYLLRNPGDTTGAAVGAALTTAGYTVTEGAPLTDYTGFDQLWDIRFYAWSAADALATANFLAGGGRVYIDSDSAGAQRDTELIALVGAVGGGTLTRTAILPGGNGDEETFTALGDQLVNTPNVFPDFKYGAYGVLSTTRGFVVTETAPGSGEGGMVAWDFGDMLGAPGARMLMAFDHSYLSNLQGNWYNSSGLRLQGWVENMAGYLGGVVAVPEPSQVALSGLGLAAVGAVRAIGSSSASATRKTSPAATSKANT